MISIFKQNQTSVKNMSCFSHPDLRQYSICRQESAMGARKTRYPNSNVFYALFLFCFLVMTLTGMTFGNITVLASPDQQKVYDNADLFSEEEESGIEDLCKKYGEEGKVDIVVVTTDDLSGKTSKKYLEDFYDKNGFGYDKKFGDATLILISMVPDNHEVVIQSYKNAENLISDDRTEYILDDVTKLLQDGDFYGAIETYAKEAAFYMNEEDASVYYNSGDTYDSGENHDGSDVSDGTGAYGNSNGYSNSDAYKNYNNNSSTDSNTNFDSIFYETWFQVVVALVIGAITVGVMAANSGGRVTVNNYTYLDEGNSGVVARRDDYIRTTVTKVKKPENNDSGGGRSSGGGGVSDGGHSHSGGSRSF